MQNTEQFAHTIAQSLLGAEADHPARPLIAMRGIRKSCLLYTSPSPRD